MCPLSSTQPTQAATGTATSSGTATVATTTIARTTERPVNVPPSAAVVNTPAIALAAHRSRSSESSTGSIQIVGGELKVAIEHVNDDCDGGITLTLTPSATQLLAAELGVAISNLPETLRRDQSSPDRFNSADTIMLWIEAQRYEHTSNGTFHAGRSMGNPGLRA